VPGGRVLDLIEARFGAAGVHRHLDIAIRWGRFAERPASDADTGGLVPESAVAGKPEPPESPESPANVGASPADPINARARGRGARLFD
jgi:hypothetical protein